MSSSTTGDLKAYLPERIVWKNSNEESINQLRREFEKDADKAIFSNEFIKDIADKRKAIVGFNFKIQGLFLIVTMATYLAGPQTTFEFQALGLSLKSNDNFQALSLIALSIISLIGTGAGFYSNMLGNILKTYVSVRVPESSQSIYRLRFLADNLNDFLVTNISVPNGHIHPIAKINIAITFFPLIIGILLFAIFPYYVIVSTLHNIVQADISNFQLKYFSILISTLAILGFFAILLNVIPVPILDRTGTTKLAELQERDNQEYQATLRRLIPIRDRANQTIWFSESLYYSTVIIFAVSIFHYAATFLGCLSFIVLAASIGFFLKYAINHIV